MCVSSVIITDGSLFVNFPSDAYALPYFRAVVFLVTCVKCALLPYRNGAEISKLDRSRLGQISLGDNWLEVVFLR